MLGSYLGMELFIFGNTHHKEDVVIISTLPFTLLESFKIDARWFYYSIVPMPCAPFDLPTRYDANIRFRKNIPHTGFGNAIGFLGPSIYTICIIISSFFYRSMSDIKFSRCDSIVHASFYASPLIPFSIYA